MIIDSYTHCGVDKFLPIEAVRNAMSHSGVERAVLCQHLGQFDNSYIRSCVVDEPDTFAGVAMIDPRDSRALENLETLRVEGIMRGVRMTAESVKSVPHFARRVLNCGLNLVLYCPDGISEIRLQLDQLADLEGSGHVIITHLGTPQIADEALTRGLELLECASNPVVTVTLSGLGMACEYPHEVAKDFVGATVDAFGHRRIMWGSNFPVLGGVDDYASDLALLLDDFWELPKESIPWISGGNAKDVWFTSTIGTS